MSKELHDILGERWNNMTEEERYNERFVCSSKNGSHAIFIDPQCYKCKNFTKAGYLCLCNTVYQDKRIPSEIFDGDVKCSGFKKK